MSRIAVDIDSTLYDFCALACQTMGEMAEERGDERLRNAAYSTTWTEWRTPIDLAGEEAWADVVERCHSASVILRQEPFPGAVEALWDLAHAGHEIVYVSNRDSSTYGPTKAWLQKQEFPCPGEWYGDVAPELLCHTDDKLASIRDCQYLIDDRPKTLVGFVNGDARGDWGRSIERKAFGLVMPYNRNLTDIPGIYLAPSWPLLSAYLRTRIPSCV